MLRNLVTIFIFLMSPISLAQTVRTTTVNAQVPPIAVPNRPRAVPSVPVIVNQKTSEEDTSQKIICPPPSDYSLAPGYRLAGISPNCMAVQIPMREVSQGLIDQNDESQQYQFTYGQANPRYRFSASLNL